MEALQKAFASLSLLLSKTIQLLASQSLQPSAAWSIQRSLMEGFQHVVRGIHEHESAEAQPSDDQHSGVTVRFK